MVKRAIITDEKFRISVPNVDVDSALDHQFVLHEQHLAAQPYHTEWVQCPFAGVGAGTYNASVQIVGPAVVLPNTRLVLYTQGASDNNYYPANIASSSSGIVDAWFTRLNGDVSNMTNLSVYFAKVGDSAAPNGAWVIFMRAPNP